MATITFNQNRKNILLAVARGDFYMNNMGGKTTIAAIEWLESNGYVDFKTTPRDGYIYFVTPKGVEWLDANMPMVDQPQPIDETTIEGAVSFYADEKAQDGTIVAGTDKYGYTVRSVNGKVYDEVKRGDIEPRLADDEDTKPLSVVTVDAPKPTLSNLIDAALNPDDTEAYTALKAYDWASVPLWCIEIERDDINAYKWDIWNELRKMDGGILLSNPDAVYKNREVDRAFNVMEVLNNAIYNFHKGVGFNVEN